MHNTLNELFAVTVEHYYSNHHVDHGGRESSFFQEGEIASDYNKNEVSFTTIQRACTISAKCDHLFCQ